MSTDSKNQVFELSIPENVTINVLDSLLSVKGPKGECSKEFSKIPVVVSVGNQSILVKPFSLRKKSVSIANTFRSLISNMIDGVINGHTYKLKIVYSHFPITVKINGDQVHIENFLGERAPRVADIRGQCNVSGDKDDVIVTGISKEDVSQTAANIEQSTKIKRKDHRVFLDGVYLYSK